MKGNRMFFNNKERKDREKENHRNVIVGCLIGGSVSHDLFRRRRWILKYEYSIFPYLCDLCIKFSPLKELR
jgi:hypothetical protein